MRARGFTYLLMLFALAAGSAALASLASAWTTAAQRQLELESRFRGQEIADAVGRWRAVSATFPALGSAGPLQLDVLLEDRRAPVLARHLRRVWDDPLTGRPDWVLLRDGEGGIEALHSRSERPALLTDGLQPRDDGQPPRVADLVFRPRPRAAPAAPETPTGGAVE